MRFLAAASTRGFGVLHRATSPAILHTWKIPLASSSALSMSTVSASDILASFPSDRSGSFVGNDVENAMACLANADAVCFDVDSTVIAEEGIDVLADYLGMGEKVAELTAQAMGGSMKFQDALAMRLKLLQPSKAQIERCLEERPLVLTPGITSLVQALKDAGKDVYLVSGGFRIMIEPIAEHHLGLDKVKNLYANTIKFDWDGFYDGFDDTEPTSADMGKPKALEQIKEANGYKTMVMVGDGATDAQAKPPADAFIGFGGVVERQKVKDIACWFVYDFADMEHVVKEFGSS